MAIGDFVKQYDDVSLYYGKSNSDVSKIYDVTQDVFKVNDLEAGSITDLMDLSADPPVGTGVGVSNDGSLVVLAAGSSNGLGVMLYDGNTDSMITNNMFQDYSPNYGFDEFMVEVSPDNSRIAVGAAVNGEIFILDSSLNLINAFTQHVGDSPDPGMFPTVSDMHFIENNTILSGGISIKVWNTEDLNVSRDYTVLNNANVVGHRFNVINEAMVSGLFMSAMDGSFTLATVDLSNGTLTPNTDIDVSGYDVDRVKIKGGYLYGFTNTQIDIISLNNFEAVSILLGGSRTGNEIRSLFLGEGFVGASDYLSSSEPVNIRVFEAPSESGEEQEQIFELFNAQAGSPEVTLAVALDNEIQEIEINESVDILPEAPNIVTLFNDTGAFETVMYSGKDFSTNKLTNVTRGFQGEAQSWAIDTKIARLITAYDFDVIKKKFDELNEFNKAFDLMRDKSGILKVTTI